MTELCRLERAAILTSPGELGLELAEAKAILGRLQAELMRSQARRHREAASTCRSCGAKRWIKDYRTRRITTLFGRVTLHLPRASCRMCDKKPTIDPVFSVRTNPELDLVGAKLAAHLPYRVAARLLRDLLPVDQGVSHTAVRGRTMAVARRLTRVVKAGAVQPTPVSEAPLTATLDGAFIRALPVTGVRHMEVLVGCVEHGDAWRQIFAAVGVAGVALGAAVDAHLRALGCTPATPLTVLTDGEEGLLNIGSRLSGATEGPILDWFHLAMRLQHLKQAACSLATGVSSHARARAEIQDELEQLHWGLWHGKSNAVQTSLERLRGPLRTYKYHHRRRDNVPKAARKVWHLMLELARSTSGQGGRLVDYGARRRAGKRVSTAMAESTVNALVNHRMNKRQQMRWSPAGAHHLLQARAAALNGALDRDAVAYGGRPRSTTTIKPFASPPDPLFRSALSRWPPTS